MLEHFAFKTTPWIISVQPNKLNQQIIKINNQQQARYSIIEFSMIIQHNI